MTPPPASPHPTPPPGGGTGAPRHLTIWIARMRVRCWHLLVNRAEHRLRRAYDRLVDQEDT